MEGGVYAKEKGRYGCTPLLLANRRQGRLIGGVTGPVARALSRAWVGGGTLNSTHMHTFVVKVTSGKGCTFFFHSLVKMSLQTLGTCVHDRFGVFTGCQRVFRSSGKGCGNVYNKSGRTWATQNSYSALMKLKEGI